MLQVKCKLYLLAKAFVKDLVYVKSLCKAFQKAIDAMAKTTSKRLLRIGKSFCNLTHCGCSKIYFFINEY